MAGQVAHSRALQKGQLPKRKDVERQPRSDWRLINCVIGMLEEKILGFNGGTAQKKSLRLSAIIFQVLVPGMSTNLNYIWIF